MNNFSSKKNYIIKNDNNFFDNDNNFLETEKNIPLEIKAIPLLNSYVNFFEPDPKEKINVKNNIEDGFSPQRQPSIKINNQKTYQQNYEYNSYTEISITKLENRNLENNTPSINKKNQRQNTNILLPTNNSSNLLPTNNSNTLLPTNNLNERLSIRSNRSSRSQINNPLFNNKISNSRKNLNSLSDKSRNSIRSRNSNRSRSRNRDLLNMEKMTDDPDMLKEIIKSKDFEINHLKEKENAYHEGGINNKPTDDLTYKINKLEIDMINLKNMNIKLKRNVEKHQYELSKIEDNLRKEHEILSKNFEKNQNENYDMMEKEMTFNYKNNDQNTIHYLKNKLSVHKSVLPRFFN